MRRGRHRVRFCSRRCHIRRLSREAPLEDRGLAILKDPTRFEIPPPGDLRTFSGWQYPTKGGGVLHSKSGRERRSEFKQVTKTLPNHAGAGNGAQALRLLFQV